MNEFILECNIWKLDEHGSWDPDLQMKLTTLINTMKEKPYHMYLSTGATFVYFMIDASDNFSATAKANDILKEMNSIVGFDKLFKIYRFKVDTKEKMYVHGK